MIPGLRIDKHMIIAFSVFIVLASCSRNGTKTQNAIHEQDGVDIVALMKNTQEALEQEDSELFQSLFSEGFQSTGRSVWQRLMLQKDSKYGDEMIFLTSCPELERASTHIHVKHLIVEMWFDLNGVYEGRNNVFHTKWVFRRSGAEPQWKLEDLKIERSNLAYGTLLADLNQLRRSDLSALGMEWEGSIDPTPLLINTLVAMADEDIEALKAYTIDGTLFYAYKNGVEMPTVANDDSVSGKHNRKQSLSYLQQQTKNLKQGFGRLRTGHRELEPYFTAYRIVSMPAACTKLKLAIQFDGSSLSKSIKSFTLSWAAARVNEKWLTEYMGIQSIQSHR